MLRNISEKRRSHLFRRGRLKLITKLVNKKFFLVTLPEENEEIYRLMGAENPYTQKRLVNV